MAATAQNAELFVGIDVSKDKLDIYLHPLGERLSIANEALAVEAFARQLKGKPVKAVAIEATGGFEAIAVAGLAAEGLPVAVVNPKQVHAFAKALGHNAKTDTLDAVVIARFAEAIKPAVRPLPDEETMAFAELLGRRRQIVQMITAEKNRAMRAATSPAMQKSVGRILRALESELAKLDGDIDGKVKASPVWREKQELLVSVPGIGKTIARTLLAEMPELGTLTGKQAASLAGLAPWTRQSGQWRGKSMIGGGRDSCRTMLFLAALTASRHNPQLRAFRDKLLNAGKPKMVILIAIARKLITILNAILRDRQPWQNA